MRTFVAQNRKQKYTMSHYDIKFLAWMSTNLLLSRNRKSKQKSHYTPPEMPKVRKRTDIFDCHNIPFDAMVSIASRGWTKEDPIYIQYQDAIRRTVLKRAEIYRPYGNDETVSVTYIADVAGIGEVKMQYNKEGNPYRLYQLLDECLVHTGMATLIANVSSKDGAMTAVRYTWDTNQQRAVPHPIVVGSIVTEDGKTFRVSRVWFEKDSYSTKEACESGHVEPRLRVIE